MRKPNNREFRLASLVAGVLLAFAIAGCEGSDGTPGADGTDAINGIDGNNGISCWDLNANGVADPEEDLNNDGVVDVLDCNGIAGGA